MIRWWNVVAMVIDILTENSSINTKASSFDISSIKGCEMEGPLQIC